MLVRPTLALLVLCSLSTQALSQVYSWVDGNGRKHFGSQPPAAQQQVETLTIKPGYAAETPAPAAVAPVQAATQEPAAGKTSKRDMCQSAMRWTVIDLKNLREIAQQRRDAGRITAAEFQQGQQNLAGAEQRITLQDCLGSSADDQQRYECLSRGAGVLACSGLLSAAMQEAEQQARKRISKP